MSAGAAAAARIDGQEAPASTVDARFAALFQRGGLTAEEAARRASGTSPDLRARQQTTAANVAAEDSAKSGWLPRIGLAAGYQRFSDIQAPLLGLPTARFVASPAQPGPTSSATPLLVLPDIRFPVYLNSYALRAGLTIPLSDYAFRVPQSVAAASHAARASESDERSGKLKVMADARVAYYQWVRGKGQLIVAEQALVQARERLDDAKKGLAAGALSRADVLRAESLVESSTLLVERARNAATFAEDQLRVATHDPGGSYEVGEDILSDIGPMPGGADLEALQRDGLARRHELRTLDHSAASLREQAKVARAGIYPRLDLAANALYANPNPRYQPAEDVFHATWDVGVTLSWVPTDIPGASASASTIAAREKVVEAQKDALRDGLSLEIKQAWLAANEAQVAIASSKKALVSAEEAYRVRRDLFRNGRGILVEVLDAETELTRARLELINAHIDARVARVRLLRASGRDEAAAP
jgi:outer membrane protein TolC